jgi:hypothetical protein
MSNYLTDRTGKPLEIGQRVRVQHCVGRYGQTHVEEGVITHMGPGGVTLDSTHWVTVDPDGYHKHEDFEHGHEVWTLIVG